MTHHRHAPDQSERQPRLKLTISAAAESAVRSGHPWVYADSVRTQNRAGRTGEFAVIYDRKDRFLAVGLFDSDSPIRVRVLHTGKPTTLDEAWWHERLRAALARRAGIADALTNGLRLINGESDGWPGLVLDRYDTTLVLKIYTAAWLPRLPEISKLILEQAATLGEPESIGTTPAPTPTRMVLRLSRNIRQEANAAGWHDAQVLHGPPLEGVVTFLETGIRFESDVLRGQKTGFFLDQRENRRRVESLARGADVLNAFSFSGGFSLYAARGGARSVTDLDISAHALASAGRNFQLNANDPAVACCRHETVQADAFNWLEGAPPSRFDLVILDPPSLAKREAERTGAIQAYGRLAANGIRLLRSTGVLVAASCSAHVSEEEFFGAVRSAARSSDRQFEEISTTGHAPDHAAAFPEAHYLKCIYLRLRGPCPPPAFAPSPFGCSLRKAAEPPRLEA
jgi:23S rRNA (cytosine1962-C5)-methyltransferase